MIKSSQVKESSCVVTMVDASKTQWPEKQEGQDSKVEVRVSLVEGGGVVNSSTDVLDHG
jgi:hypothetical protein